MKSSFCCLYLGTEFAVIGPLSLIFELKCFQSHCYNCIKKKKFKNKSHIFTQSVFTHICESKELTEFESGTVIRFQHCNKSANFFPHKYSMISCKWQYCKVEAFKNYSSSATKWQTVEGFTAGCQVLKCIVRKTAGRLT